MLKKDEIIKSLWKLLDDIDSASDACKHDDTCYRTRVNKLAKKRFELNISSSDGAIDLDGKYAELVHKMNILTVFESKDNDGFICKVDGKLTTEDEEYFSNMTNEEVVLQLDIMKQMNVEYETLPSTYSIEYLVEIGLI